MLLKKERKDERMKKNKKPWGSLGALIGVIIAITALVRGKWQFKLTLTVLILWGIWLAVSMLSPYFKRYRRCRDRRKQKKNVKAKEYLPRLYSGLQTLTFTHWSSFYCAM